MSLLLGRAPVAFAGGLLVALGLFLFMQTLIRPDRDDDIRLPVYEDVRVLREEPEQQLEEPDLEPEQAKPEPQSELPPLPAPTVVPQSPADLALPEMETTVLQLDIPVGNTWSAPLASGGIGLESSGEDGRRYVEVVPYNTRRPNVPEAAWHNRINGWVLVAFSVTPDGKTRDIRVLDANPRGVFEEKVVAAVRDWRYRVSIKREFGGDVVLTQKVDVRWENFPQNLPNVD